METLLATDIDRLPSSLLSVIRLLDPNCTREAAREVISQDTALFETARREFVAVLVFDRWGDTLAERLSPQALDRWQNLRYSAVAIPAQRRAGTVGALRALSAAGVQPVVMRGLWLAEAVYEDPALRQFADIDLAAPIEALETVAQVMRSEGFSFTGPPEGPIEADGVRERLRRGFYDGLGFWRKPISEANHVEFDFHVTLHVVSVGWWPYRPTQELMYERSEPWELEGAQVRAFLPDFALLAHCENMCRHELAWSARRSQLIRYYDIVQMARLVSDEGWERLIGDARELRLGIQLAALLAKVAEMWGAWWPEDLLERLGWETGYGRLAGYAVKRPRWLGKRGRIALFQACATRSPLDAARYGVRNIIPGLRGRTRRRSEPPDLPEERSR